MGLMLALTMGDPAGIGPEIVVKAAARLWPRIEAGEFGLLVLGHATALREAAGFASVDIPVVGEADDWPGLALLPADEERELIPRSAVSAEAGRFAYLAIEKAVQLAQAGRVDAIVTAPLNKEALNLAGYHYAGHTELLAELTGRRGSVMLLAHGDFRVSHVTTHVALEKVPGLLTPERLSRVIELTHQAVRDLGVAEPRIAVAALNPHAGEGGLFGEQDIKVSTPVIEAYRAGGMDVSGPVPGDTVFVKLRARQVRCGCGDVPRSGAHPGETAGVQCRCGDREVAGVVGGEYHTGAADHPHLRGSRHGVRHRGQRDRERGESRWRRWTTRSCWRVIERPRLIKRGSCSGSRSGVLRELNVRQYPALFLADLEGVIMKLGIVGAGTVGRACLVASVMRGMAREIVLVDRTEKKARGMVTDVTYGAVLSPSVSMRAGDYADLAGCALVMLTIGVNEKAGGATDRSDPEGRLKLLAKNKAIFQGVVPRIAKAAPDCILLVVTDPPDALADIARGAASGLNVVSTGTYLDSLRLRVHIGRKLEMHPGSVDAHVIGEHGTSEVFLWSSARVAVLQYWR